MTVCHECGKETAEDALFCHDCGASLAALPISASGTVAGAHDAIPSELPAPDDQSEPPASAVESEPPALAGGTDTNYEESKGQRDDNNSDTDLEFQETRS